MKKTNNPLYPYIITIVLKQLGALERVLGKAATYSKEKNIPEIAILEWRMFHDMFNFKRQIQIATDDARRNLYLLAGKEHIKFDDKEKTFKELKNRIIKTKKLIQKLKSTDFKGAELRHISLYWMGDSYVRGKEFVNEFLIQNLSFHVVTAYNILRAHGVSIGKADYTGPLSMKKKSK